MTLESLAQELYELPIEEREPVRDSYRLAKEFVDTFYKQHGLLLLVGDTEIIIENTVPINRAKDIPHDFMLERLGYPKLNIYDGRIGSFLREVENGLPDEQSIRDLATAIDNETGDVIGARLYIKGSTGEDVETVPGGASRHLSAADASTFDNIYAIAVSETRGKVTPFKDGKIDRERCYDSATDRVQEQQPEARPSSRSGYSFVPPCELPPELEMALDHSG